MQKRNFVIRTIRNSEVKIFHKVFIPNDEWMEYDGRLDGLRMAFGLYWNGDKWEDSFVAMWGTEGYFNAAVKPDKEFREWLASQEKNSPDLVEGYYPWMWWHRKDGIGDNDG